MTDADLKAIEERAAKATPGAWDRSEESHDYYYHGYRAGPADCINRIEDAEFIAHAREDIPALIVEVKRLRELFVGDAKSEYPGCCHICMAVVPGYGHAADCPVLNP